MKAYISISCHSSWFLLGSGPYGSGLVEQAVNSKSVKKRSGLCMITMAFYKLTNNPAFSGTKTALFVSELAKLNRSAT
jgi:hypothetical protein